MKTKVIVISLLASALNLFAAPESPKTDLKVQCRFADMQDGIIVFSGKPVVMLGDMRVHAETITYHRDSGRMEGSGEVRIETPKGILTGRDVLIDTKEHKLTMRAVEVSAER